MPAMIATLLGGALIAIMAVAVNARMQQSLIQSAYRAEVMQAASQQSAFARGVLAYIQQVGPPEGVIISTTDLIGAGVLDPGFPSTNPFGQTPEAIIGSGKAAIITYAAIPTQAIMSGLQLNSLSSINLQALAFEEADDIAAMQEGSPEFAGGMLSNGILSTPFQTLQIPVSNFVSGAAIPTGPIFADLLNVLPVPTTSSPGTTGYGSVTGD